MFQQQTLSVHRSTPWLYLSVSEKKPLDISLTELPFPLASIQLRHRDYGLKFRIYFFYSLYEPGLEIPAIISTLKKNV